MSELTTHLTKALLTYADCMWYHNDNYETYAIIAEAIPELGEYIERTNRQIESTICEIELGLIDNTTYKDAIERYTLDAICDDHT